MSLLEEIQSAAVDSSSDLGGLLRKCKMLAARLGSQPLEDWLLRESNGHPSDVDVPDYRVWPVQLKGTFAGSFRSITKNVPIPLALVPERARKCYENYKCRQSIASIEATLAKSKGSLTISTGDLAVMLGESVYEDQTCVEAWGIIPEGNLVEVLNSVRNRILDFALAIWKQDPAAGDIYGDANGKIEAAQVNQIFHTTVYGGAATVVGNSQNSLLNINVTANNFKSLEATLKQHAVSNDDLQELQAAIADDPHPTEKNKFGPRVSSWIGKMAKMAAEGLWNTTLDVGTKVLVEALTKYYGLS
jgi:hypothetical protein